MTVPSLSLEALAALEARAREGLESHLARYPGDSGTRQPAHVVYGGAHLFRRDSARRLGDVALRSMEEYAPTAADLFAALDPGVESTLASRVYERVRAKLEREPVEDFRIDFEDGFGVRPDDEEDRTAIRAAEETAAGWADGTLPPFLGIRIKPLSGEWARRGLRTLDLYLTTLADRSGAGLPAGFVVTLPKIVSSSQVAALVEAFEALEGEIGLPPGALKFEIMVETPQSLIGADGSCPLPRFLEAGAGRLVAAHFGVYDFTASTGITAEYQRMQHPLCDAARHVMRIAFSETSVMLSDGATNLLPVPRHRGSPEGPALTDAQRRDNRESVHHAWRLHYEDIQHSLASGFYQGWDLHPAQLVTRYAAVYTFFQQSLDAAAERLGRFVEQAARATLTGDVFDDAATGQGLLNFFLRGLACGALTEEEALRTGLSLEELGTRSFARILEGRTS